MIIDDLKSHSANLDIIDIRIADKRIAEKGLENYLSQQLIYLDCSRIIKGMRMMQTIGYPYTRELAFYFYALDKAKEDRDETFINEWADKLVNLHKANLEYEKDNPPIWYGGAKAKKAWEEANNPKPARRKKVAESTLPGFGKEVSAAASLKQKLAGYADVKFKLKLPKK